MNANEKSVDLSCAGIEKARAEAREIEHFTDLLTSLTQIIGDKPQLLRDVLEITYAHLRDSEVPACPYIVADIMELYNKVVPTTCETVYNDGEYHHTLAQFFSELRVDGKIQFVSYFPGEMGSSCDSHLTKAYWNRIPMHPLDSGEHGFTDGIDCWHVCSYASQYITEEDRAFGPTADLLSSG
jgi:hypothetical protein